MPWSSFDALLDRLQRERHPHALDDLRSQPLLEALAVVLGSGTHLFEDFLRLKPSLLLPILRAVTTHAPLDVPVPTKSAGLEDFLAWRDAELFRIECEHLMNPNEPFGVLSEKLTALAEKVVRLAWERCAPEGLEAAVFALGKFGGGELGFASDLELMVVYEEQSPEEASRANEAVRRFLKSLPARREGIFEVDLRLRPFGGQGPLAVSGPLI